MIISTAAQVSHAILITDEDESSFITPILGSDHPTDIASKA
ncbi:hypothetical protein [Reichenbachiella agariperforans]|nr:hypothetical protein [Reichenbachiella agariperforans]